MTLTYALLLLIAAADVPLSGALLQELPPDGTWATYNVSVKVEGQDVSLSWTARSVGTAFCDGKDCRLIEIEQVNEVGSRFAELKSTCWRMVIPEDAFGTGTNPIAAALRTWVKVEDQEPVSIDSLTSRDPILSTVLSGPAEKLQALPEREKISWQRGELACQVIAGETNAQLGPFKLKMQQRVLRNAEIPCGTAGLHIKMVVTAGGSDYPVQVTVNLRDHGKDAQAKLPGLLP